MKIVWGLILFLGLLLLEAILFFGFLIIIGIGKDASKENTKYHKGYRKIYNLYIRFLNSLFNVKMKKIGFDKIPKGPVIFIANHRSNMDPIIMEQVLSKWDLIFVGKKSLFSIPFFGKIINHIGYQRINSNFLIEKDPKEVFQDKKHDLQTIKNCIDIINDQHISVAIYPEAMRNFQDKVLLEFKHGVFHIARRTGVPIVVMTLKGTEDFKSKLLFKRHPVEVKVLDVIESSEYLPLSNDELSKKLYDMMYDDIKD
ncbi:MAG: 1-acyl-sn-glycerol-3-phosphate acyltransferase, partial [Bacilli bacterium]|nr:1-acyl-sn-glycerol-3-phosphate acyltransferase [Bacilli bacterium]